MIPCELESRFRLLGIAPQSDWDQVKSAFRRLARTCHPDVAGPESSARFAEINEAYMDIKGFLLSGKTPQGPLRPSPPHGTSRPRTGKGQRRKEAEPAREKTRQRRLDEALDEATRRVEALLRKSVERKREDLSGHLERLRSAHPAVVLLALEGLASRVGEESVRKALVDLLCRPSLEREVLDRVIDLVGPANREIMVLLSRRALSIDAEVALPLVRSLRGLADRAGLLTPWLSHRSEKVVAEALAQWPLSAPPPDDLSLSRRLRRSEEALLIPLLRLLHRCGAPAWAVFSLKKLAVDHPAAAVRVWARSVVSQDDLG